MRVLLIFQFTLWDELVHASKNNVLQVVPNIFDGIRLEAGTVINIQKVVTQTFVISL